MAYVTVAQCEAKLDYYLGLEIRARDVMDAAGNRVTSLSPKDVAEAITFWERMRDTALDAESGSNTAIAICRRASE